MQNSSNICSMVTETSKEEWEAQLKDVIVHTTPYALTGSCQIYFYYLFIIYVISKDTKLSILIYLFFLLLVLSEIHLERTAKQKIDKPQGSTSSHHYIGYNGMESH